MKAYQVLYVLKPAVEEELVRLEKEGVISHVVTNQYPLPRIDDVFNNLTGQFFTVIDLSEAYLQLQVASSRRHFLTVNTHKGLYQFNRLCYGIASAPSKLQAVMENILIGLENIKCIWIISGKSIDNCKNKVYVVFLGHMIDKHGVRPTDDKMEVILNTPQPKDTSQLKSFLGLVNYYQEGNIDEDLGSIMLVEQLPLTFHEIAKETSEDAVLKIVYEQVKSGWVDHKNYKD
ncbi:uncharacterized protein K02A2.6-like [Metopolophium dirhodum]|uniref:uncharacterized protein K02A2.6-like n=1 Tax=Metopolophium dirhodum TaxID=44670 RepID=UPI00299045AB|nr:uncharacterized protein K02A2.6-like [Metopolophium dirhodum]